MPDDADNRGLPWTGWVGLGALVLMLAALVVWSIPRGDGAAATGGDGGEERETETSTGTGTGTGEKDRLKRLAEASCELAVLTDKSMQEAEALASADAITKLLDMRHCGGECELAKRAIAESHFELEAMKADDFILPPRDAFDVIAPGLTKDERDRAAKAPTTLVVKTRGPATIDQLPARACFAAAAAAAEALSGFVYDESERRIETAAELESHAIKVPAGHNVFLPKQIAIQIYRQEDGSARVLTLGMARFGSPDYVARGSTMSASGTLANVLNAVCSRAAEGKTQLPFVIGVDEMARVAGRRPAELAADPAASKPLRLQGAEAERVEGDSDNDVIIELLPDGGDTPEAWSAAIATLTGAPPDLVFVENDPELDRIAAAARRDLPGAIKRFEAHDGALYVKGPFPIPPKEGEVGTRTEAMWIEVTSCDKKACSGILSNDPGYATNLTAGSPARVVRSETADWVLRMKDGGTAGGASIRALTQRAAHDKRP